MGKYIYLMDAYEDVEKDEKKDRYNPLRTLKKDNPKKVLIMMILSFCIYLICVFFISKYMVQQAKICF